MPKEHEFKITNPVMALVLSLAIRWFFWFFHIVLAGIIIATAIWGIRLFFPLTIFEAGLLSLGICGVVMLNAIHSKVSSIKNMVEHEEWNEDYDFYSEEDEEPLVNQEKEVNSETEDSQGKVISLEQRLSGKKQDK